MSATASRAHPAAGARIKKAQSRRGAWIAVATSVVVIGALVGLAVLTDAPQLLFKPEQRQASQAAVGDAAENPHAGTVIMQRDNQECQQRTFDNDSGRMSDATKPCNTSNVVLDSHGVPVPMGTVHRLNAISKSFSGGQ